jgi:hypothetical protein
MGCCTARAPSPEKEPCPCPNQDDNRGGRISPLAMLAANNLTCGGSSQGALFGRFASDGDRSFADATLQAKHIRIDA